MAELFYAEPVVTFDLDGFVSPPSDRGLLSSTPVYDALAARGYAARDECVLIEGVPVQFLPAPTALVEEALLDAREAQVDGETTRVFTVEHLIAVAIQTNRPTDRERVQRLLQLACVDRPRLEQICRRHQLKTP